MTIRIGPIDRIVVHYGEATAAEIPRPLCVKGGGRLNLGLSTFTLDPERVTCDDCLEWMHA